MESKFSKFIKEDKELLTIYAIWIFLHVIFLIQGQDLNGFWPMNSWKLRYYGLTEFLIYVVGPLLAVIAIRVFGDKD